MFRKFGSSCRSPARGPSTETGSVHGEREQPVRHSESESNRAPSESSLGQPELEVNKEELAPAPRQETAGGAHPRREEGDSALEAAAEATDPEKNPPLEEGDGFLREWSEEYAKSSHWGELWAQT